MKVTLDEFVASFRVPHDRKISLTKDYDPGYKAEFISKADAKTTLAEGIKRLAEFQDKLYAQNRYGLLIVLQALDAAGKDGCIKHVMSGINPQGCQVSSFKAPSDEELDHDYLWRSAVRLPSRGTIGIFNRSYYEEVLVVRVHPELLARQHLRHKEPTRKFWKQRFEQINNFERYLVQNDIIVLKFFLNVSKEEQKRRFLERIDQPEKNWKFSVNDVRERAFRDDYLQAYEEAFNHTSTPWAPWYIVPADHKWFTRLGVAATIYWQLQKLELEYPKPTEAQLAALSDARQILEQES